MQSKTFDEEEQNERQRDVAFVLENYYKYKEQKEQKDKRNVPASSRQLCRMGQTEKRNRMDLVGFRP